MAGAEYFEKTPKKSTRWFRAFIIFTLLFGAMFSLNWFINWVLFFAASYSLFMSYFLLPVQPKIFQNRQRASGSQFRSTSSSQPTTDQATQRKRAIIIMFVIVAFVIFLIPFMVGVIEGIDEEISNTDSPVEETLADGDINLVQKGNDFFNEQRYDSAEKYYDMALDGNIDDTAALYGKGIVAYNLGRIDEANVYFLKAYDGGYRYAWLSWALADMSEKQGQTVRAIEFYKESVQLDSAYTDSYLRLAELDPSNGGKWRNLAETHK